MAEGSQRFEGPQTTDSRCALGRGGFLLQTLGLWEGVKEKETGIIFLIEKIPDFVFRMDDGPGGQ